MPVAQSLQCKHGLFSIICLGIETQLYVQWKLKTWAHLSPVNIMILLSKHLGNHRLYVF